MAKGTKAEKEKPRRPLALPPASLIDGYGEFEIDIVAVLQEELPLFFERIPVAPLTTESVATIPARAKGAYLLLRNGVPVYAGKTDAKNGFRDRLKRHSETILDRQGLEPSQMSYKAARVMVFSVLDVEAVLIREMRALNPDWLTWNNSGFGSNDPGVERDTQKPARFDREFPIDIDRAFEFEGVGAIPFPEAVEVLKSKVEYLIRVEENPSLADYSVTIPASPATTARSMLRDMLRSLPKSWQVTVLHGRVIVYEETKTYKHALDVMRGEL
jgi:hypothetical protein